MAYFTLKIIASSTKTTIWLGDMDGCLVKKAIGVMELDLMPGDYTAQFELGTECFPICFHANHEISQSQLMAGPQCKAPVFRWLPI